MENEPEDGIRTPQRAHREARLSGVMEAWENGEALEVGYHQGGFLHYNLHPHDRLPAFHDTAAFWRKGPKDPIRPWYSNEIPVGNWIRWKTNPSNEYLIVPPYGRKPDDVHIFKKGGSYAYKVGTCAKYMQHSADRVNWLPCGVRP